ncbi:MAG TPA: hypothetical protein VE890_02535, partial [Thermoguttaceae bacterium]|nr:hypothetical protein [Thermoguttaceae bacterium]
MSQSDDRKHEELRDRLMDQALEEVLGGQSSPDLSDKILAAVEKQKSVSPQPKERVMGKSKRGFKWVYSATAVCLLVGVTVALLLPAIQKPRAAARRPSSLHDSRQADDARPSESAEPEAAEAFRYSQDTAASESYDIEPSDSSAPAAPEAPAPMSPVATNPSVEFVMDPSARPAAAQTRPLNDAFGRQPTPTSESKGQGPGMGGDQYDHLVENPFRTVADHPL